MPSVKCGGGHRSFDFDVSPTRVSFSLFFTQNITDCLFVLFVLLGYIPVCEGQSCKRNKISV